MMKRKMTVCLIIFTLIGLCTFFSAGCQPDDGAGVDNNTDSSENETDHLPDDKLLIVTGEYEPYTSEQIANYGFFTQIVEAVLNDCGIDYELKFYPWARCEAMVEDGTAWATFPYLENEARAERFNFSDSVYDGSYRFYYLSANQQLARDGAGYTQLSDFAGYTFGGISGYWYGTRTDIENLGLQTEWVSDTDALIKMLYAGRIDFFIEDELVADIVIKRLFPDDVDAFAKLPNSASTSGYHLLVSRNYPDNAQILQKFNVSLQKLQENGEIDRILIENGIEVR